MCPEKQCLFPKPCRNLNADHSDYIALLKKLRAIPKGEEGLYPFRYPVSTICWQIKRHDFLKELCEYHVSGQLKVAPEHISDNVLKRMGKPENSGLPEVCEGI